MAIDWKRKFSSYLEASVDLILEGLVLALWITVTFGLALLTRVTVGEHWPQVGDQIVNIALIIILVVGCLELIVSVSVRAYYRLRREIQRDG